MDGDRWDIHPLPLGEVTEAYRVSLRRDGYGDWATQTDTPQLTLPALEILRSSAGGDEGCVIEVAQISDRAGAGHPARLEVVL